jgi:hypothetical protein
MAMVLIALLAVFLPALQTETAQTATMQSDVDRLVRAAEGLADQSAEKILVSRIFASWNHLKRWLRQVERLRGVA